jgi:hypothetical protein
MDKADVIANVIVNNFDLICDQKLVNQIEEELDMVPQDFSDFWVMAYDSPRSMAVKILQALEASDG